MINKVILIGRSADCPRTTKSGSKIYAEIRLACSIPPFRVDSIEWIDVTFSGKSAENAVRMIDKGSLVYVEGYIRTKRFEINDKRYVKQMIQAIRFLVLAKSKRG